MRSLFILSFTLLIGCASLSSKKASSDQARGDSAKFSEALSHYRYCKNVSSSLSSLRGYQDPDGHLQCVWGTQWYCKRQHEAFVSNREKMLALPEYEKIKRILIERTTEFFTACYMKDNLKEIVTEYKSSFPGFDLLEEILDKNKEALYTLENKFDSHLNVLKEEDKGHELFDKVKQGHIKSVFEQNIYVVTLKLKESEHYRLGDEDASIFDLLTRERLNEMNAKYSDLIVSKEQYEKWTPGDTLSSQLDWLLAGAMLLGLGGVSTFETTVYDKKIVLQHFVEENKSIHEISSPAYAVLMQEIKDHKDHQSISFEDFGKTTTLIFPKEPSMTSYQDLGPAKNCTLKIKVKNDSFTLDFLNHARNFIDGYEPEYQAPEAACHQAESHKTDFHFGKYIFKGQLSAMSGKVLSHTLKEQLSLRHIKFEGFTGTFSISKSLLN